MSLSGAPTTAFALENSVAAIRSIETGLNNMSQDNQSMSRAGSRAGNHAGSRSLSHRLPQQHKPRKGQLEKLSTQGSVSKFGQGELSLT